MLLDTLWLSQPTPRPDEDVLADVGDRLWLDDTTRASERSALAVDVRDGHVFLTGHVTDVRYRQHVVDLVRGVRGVRAIHNALIADPDLLGAVAQALAAEARTRPSVIRVGASHGWILLAGEVPDVSTRLAAEEVSARVPGVRGVLGLPHLPHATGADKRRALQPRVGQPVYAADGRAGLVKQVIIDPQNRLVSHLIVVGIPEVNWLPVRGGWVVPVEAVAQATDGGVFLAEKLSPFVARPAYDPADYCLPPPDWQLPFPYETDEVSWRLETTTTPIAIPTVEFFWDSDLRRPAAVTPLAVQQRAAQVGA